MVRTCVDSALEQLRWLESHRRLSLPMKDQIQTLQMELRFLKMFFWSLATWKASAKNFNLSPAMIDIENSFQEAEKGLYAAGVIAIHKRQFRDWDLLIFNWIEKIRQSKPEIRGSCFLLLNCSLHCKSSSSYEILEFFDTILGNLKDILSSKDDMIVSVKEQIGALEDKLMLLRNFVDFIAERCIISYEKLRNLWKHIWAWANYAACLSFLYWVDEMDEKGASGMNMLSGLVQKIKPFTVEVMGMYLEVLKALKPSRSDILLKGELIVTFVNFLLEDLVVPMTNGIEILGQELIFLITFLMDPPKTKNCTWDDKLIWRKADTVVSEAASLVCSLSVEGSAEKKNVLLHDFLERINIVKAKVKEQYVVDSPWYNFPRTNGLGFINNFMENLKQMLACKHNFIPFTKHQIRTMQEELVSLTSLLKDILELQNEHDELKDLWMRIIHMAYEAENVINLFSSIDFPVWYNMIRIFDVMEEIRFTQTEVKNTRAKVLNAKKHSSQVLSAQANTSRINDVVVGFEDEAKTIIDRLTRGSVLLDFVAIVGMPGLGKTTLANKVYNDPLVQYHFNKCAWCYVSQTYSSTKLLLDILGAVLSPTDEITAGNDIAEQIYKCLKGRRYLIVFDDIWDIRIWDEFKCTFPDDINGSRIMFTSRIHNISLQAKPDCRPHALNPLSDNESWELLQKKLFYNNQCPPVFLEIGYYIAKKCNGLPLAILLVAGLLARNVRNLGWWIDVAQSLISQIASEGCMDILEVSYRHLPNFLRPCFLYFGAFRDDKTIKARKLTQLWIVEGFVQKSERKSLEDVAVEYLMDLVGRSLVIVTKRSSNGGIKACQVHDLLRYFCLKKAREENFLQLLSPSRVNYEQYQLCIHTQWGPVLESKPIASRVRSLLIFSPNDYWAQYVYTSAFSMKCKFLRVLDLDSICLKIFFPEEIVSLVHLRYLAICGYITHVPSSINNLQDLEIFCLRILFSTVDIPSSIWNLKRLRHVDISRDANISLGHYDGSCQLNNIVAFASPVLSRGKDAEKLLRRLPNVQNLRCKFLGSMYGHNEDIQFPVLDFLVRLEALNVLYAAAFPYSCALNFPSTLKKLTLSEFRLPWSEISPVAKLPNLQVLKLLSDAFLGCRWDVENEEFLKLKFLKLQSLNVAEWNASVDSFPCLQQLVLQHCYNLEEIPSIFGEISTLKTLEVSSCKYNLTCSVREIYEEQREIGNVLEVLIS